MRAAAGMWLWIAYSALAVAGAFGFDEAGEQLSGFAFDLRVDAPLRGSRTDDRVGFVVAERTSVVHDLGTQGEWHTHRDRHTPGPAARPSAAVAFGPGQVAPPVLAVRMPLVDPLVEALVADPHRRVSRILQFQPALDQLGRPATRQRVRHPRVQARVHHAPGLPRPARTCLGLALRGQRRIERASRPRPRLQPPGMVDGSLEKLPCARGLWVPRPGLKASAECWLRAGGSHHTCMTTSIGREAWEDFARIAGVELAVIDEDTTPRGFERDLQISEMYHRLDNRH